jgi:alpha-D-xyloside xylohydrolase
MPYIFAAGVTAHEKGIPTMRPMMLAFHEDSTCPFLDTQYMLGDSFLVAPIFNTEGERKLYLPETNGAWTNWFTGEKSDGGKFIFGKHDYFSLGLWVKPNSIIAMQDNVFRLFEIENAEAIIYDENGKEKYRVKAVRDGEKISVTSTCSHGITVFHNGEEIKI